MTKGSLAIGVRTEVYLLLRGVIALETQDAFWQDTYILSCYNFIIIYIIIKGDSRNLLLRLYMDIVSS